MTNRICPWWLGYLLVSPLRRWMSQAPEVLLARYLREGMTVLEPGPGMGFFTLPMAKMLGARGRIIAVDIQAKMLETLRQRMRKAGLADRVETRLARPESLGISDLTGLVDFALAFAVVHEMPSTDSFFEQMAVALKPGGLLLLAEPKGHVNAESWQRELNSAQRFGLSMESCPPIGRSLSALFKKA